ncbi:hypothetical protein [Luteolibacter sp. LG18]
MVVIPSFRLPFLMVPRPPRIGFQLAFWLGLLWVEVIVIALVRSS